MRIGRPLLAVMAVLLLLVPASQAQIDNPDESTPTTLYFHIFDTLNKFVINNQPMNADFFEVGGPNFPSIRDTPVNDLTGADYDFNTIYGTSTAGPVEYDFIENGKPRFHPERGIAADVQIDQAVQPVAYVYVDVRDLFGVNGAPNALPTLTVAVTMREGDDPGRDADLDSGTELMSGSFSFHAVDASLDVGALGNGAFCTQFVCDPAGPFPEGTLAGSVNDQLNEAGLESPDGLPILFADEDQVIEVAIPMDLKADTIPKAEAFNVRIDWYQELGGLFEEDQFAEGQFRLYAAPDKQPRLEMNIMNPIYIEFVHPQVAAGTLLIHTGVNSPWGTYDVDAQNITLSVDGPSAPQNLEQVVAQNQHVHGLHDKAAEITYLWKFRDEEAADGEYTIQMTVPNVDGTATASATAGFTVEGAKAFGEDTEGNIVEPTGDEGSNGSPGAGLLATSALLGVVLLARRRSA